MPSLAEHHSADIVKMLLIGDSGSGKTGALTSLIDAGFNLYIIDMDNGLDPLRHYVKDKSLLSNVQFETITDKFKTIMGKIIPDGTPDAFGRAMQKLTKWDDEFGSPSDWGRDDVLVIDSGTFLSTAALRYVLAVNGRAGAPAQIQDWGEAMRMLEDTFALLYSDAIHCNVIMTFHISYVEGATGGMIGYPSTLGQKLPPKIGRYFNTIVQTKNKGAGASSKKIIRTISDGIIELKTPAIVPAEYPLETGLADLFAAIRGDKK